MTWSISQHKIASSTFDNGCVRAPFFNYNMVKKTGMDTKFRGLPPSLYKQPPNRVDAQAKRIQRAEEAFRKVDKPGAGVEEVVIKLVSLVEEVHKLVKGPHHAIAYWENQLHQVVHNTVYIDNYFWTSC